MKTYKIYTLGCKVNQYDSGSLATSLKTAGFTMVNKNAGIAIINSCAVTKTAIIKSGRMVKLAKKENPKAKIILTGCWPKAYKTKDADVDYVMNRDKIYSLVKKITNCKLLVANKIKEVKQENRSRYFIKIQDGCEQYCSYCIVPYTRGKLKSRGEKEIICEIKRAVKTGYEEIVLSGIHLGLYGKERQLSLRATKRSEAISRTNFKVNSKLDCHVADAPRNDNLVSLLKKIIKINDLGRVRLSSIEVTEVSDDLIKLIANSKKICQHLYIPLQSGSDKILKLMNRPYSKKYFLDKVKKIRRAMPDVAITTDVIVGFPGETEKDFIETKKFIREIKFSRLHIFPFSAHAKLPAAKFPNQVEEKIKAKRAKILREFGVKLMRDYKRKFKGKKLEIVIEQIKQDKLIGKTEYYFDIEVDKRQIFGSKIDGNNKLIGKIVKVKNN
ncbi:MAG: MiaB/RimO family radical SAM methylthiotransferase [Patescibacteria group bacterium]|jgi:threonylcarbamoyladenosine tRNA methylthiotransferase MtaB